MAKTGRPPGQQKREIDIAKAVREMASRGSPKGEIASVLQMDIKTLNSHYSQDLLVGVEDGKNSVRKMLFLHGQKGNSTALKYLIHNILKERLEPEVNLKEVIKTISGMSDQDFEEFKKKQIDESKSNS